MQLAPRSLASTCIEQAAVLQHNVRHVSMCGRHRSGAVEGMGSARLQCHWQCRSTATPADGASQVGLACCKHINSQLIARIDD